MSVAHDYKWPDGLLIVSSADNSRRFRQVMFEDMPTEDLKDLVQPISDFVGRHHLLEILRNRYGGEYMLVEEGPIGSPVAPQGLG